MFCEHFKFEELSEEFLNDITHVNALEIHLQNKNPDKLYNWGKGKKLSAYTIVDCYRRECKEKEECITVPTCCDDYLKEIDIQDIKRCKAYFTWECRGRENNITDNFMRMQYLDGCNEIFIFCDEASNKGKECKYYKMLSMIDQRKNVLDRRFKQISVSNDDRKGNKNRRIAQDYRILFLNE